ncbi:DUF6891 domain-containing protein [Tenacibaculum finnmarkense]|uniref:DUF6891 domain-containing protein n=1 Tax=Tenacibaculum finnmarkense TaxID=2781243 RepID=UPI001E3F9B5F|nr:hypothetical protein [Tenacibaculum finnmarkense]MCD8445501.1 hypothetical protein [Tenacibaculum finnmarkense genomovar ulcerans]
MTENEEFIFESIYTQVRIGFSSISEIKENIIEEIEDNKFEKEISEKWVFETIEKEHQKLISESRNWKTPTDTEKLIEAFDELCKNNIIALHNAGYETSDGEYEVVQVENKLNQNQTASDGYCFYHEQDLSRAISLENPCLYLAFQKVENSDDGIALAVGRKIVTILLSKGFEIEWNEDVSRKILIKNFQWQYLFEYKRDLHDYDEVIELMLMEKEQSKNSKFSYNFCLKTDEIYNINPSSIDVINVIEDMKYSDKNNPSFVVLELKKSKIMFLQVIVNDDDSYIMELREGNLNDFKHYRFNTKEKSTIINCFKRLFDKKDIDYSKWKNVTEEFIEQN